MKKYTYTIVKEISTHEADSLESARIAAAKMREAYAKADGLNWEDSPYYFEIQEDGIQI